jgi:heme exporter protein B
MNSSLSSWLSEIGAIFQKEWKAESRSLSGITTTALLCFVSVVVIYTITADTSIHPMIGAGMYWIILIFAASVSLPRTFIQEEENRTADFWRLMARPEAVFWGKALFNTAQMLTATAFMSVLFIGMSHIPVTNPTLFILTSFGGAIAIASTVTITGAIAAPANNRSALAAGISVPILLFLVSLGVSGTATSFGENLVNGEKTPIVMILYAIAVTTMGPVVYSRIWKA